MKKSEVIDAVVELMQDKSAAARALVGRWVNVGLDDLASRGLLKSLQREERTSLVAGDGASITLGRDYSLDSDTHKVFKCFVPAWGIRGILTKKREEEFLTRVLSDGATYQSMPEIYTVFGLKTLRIHPIPNSTYAPAAPSDLQKLYIWKYKAIEHLQEGDEIEEVTQAHTPLLMWHGYKMGARFDSMADVPLTTQEYESAIARFFRDQNADQDSPAQMPYRDL